MKTIGSLIATFALTGMSQAAMTLAFVHDASTGNTVASYSGTWDIYTGIQTAGSIQPSLVDSNFFFISDGGIYTFTFDDFFQGATFSWNAATVTGQTGDPFGFDSQFAIYAPVGYTAGGSISGTVTFAGTDLATLGLLDGESGIYTSNLGNSVSYTAETVPEPSSSLISLVAVGAFLSRRRR